MQEILVGAAVVGDVPPGAPAGPLVTGEDTGALPEAPVETPEEIAVSIAGEMIGVKNARL